MSEPVMTSTERTAELTRKLAALRAMLDSHAGDTLALTWRRNFAWATSGGDNHVAATTEDGFATLVVTQDDAFIVTATNESARLASEELEGLPLTVHAVPWHVAGANRLVIEREAPGRLLLDRDVEASMSRLRARLSIAEQQRVAWVGARAARAMTATFEQAHPGQSELTIGALLIQQLADRNLRAQVLLVAADDRIVRFRHPIPTPRCLRVSLMLVVAAERWGLQVALTRMGWFGEEPSDDTWRRFRAARAVELRMRAATRPGARLDSVLREAVAAYARVGYGHEWQLHHQGGTIAYWGRETLATPDCDETLEAGMAVAWSPSITGVKVEETMLVRVAGAPLLLTCDPAWPTDDGGEADIRVAA